MYDSIYVLLSYAETKYWVTDHEVQLQNHNQRIQKRGVLMFDTFHNNDYRYVVTLCGSDIAVRLLGAPNSAGYVLAAPVPVII